MNQESFSRYLECVEDLLNHPEVAKMQEITQHRKTNCYEHSLVVSYISYKVCKFFRLDYTAGARGALLHDLFLYDQSNKESHNGWHWTSHPKTALKNASQICDLSEKEKDIILKHMWPLTIQLPRYSESFVVNMADKISAIAEGLCLYQLLKLNKRLYVTI